MNKQFTIDGGKLVGYPGAKAIIPPVGMVPILIETEPGKYLFAGNRKIQQSRPHGETWKGWTFYKSEQIPCKGTKLEWGGMELDFGIVTHRPYQFPLAFRVDNRNDGKRLEAMGLNGRKSPTQWARALGWKGHGGIRAAEELWKRWQATTQDRKTLPECPSVSFPPLVERVPDAMEAMKAEIAELRAAMEAVQSRLALLEFQP